jgi:hypothetical protein
MCLLTLVLCKNYTNSKSQLISCSKSTKLRVPDILAFVLKGIRLTKILYMLKAHVESSDDYRQDSIRGKEDINDTCGTCV